MKKSPVPGKVLLGEEGTVKGGGGDKNGGGRKEGGGGLEERRGREVGGGFPRFSSFAEAEPCSSRPGRPESAGDSTKPGPVSGRGLYDSLPAATAAYSSPLLSPSRPPAEARAPATPRPPPQCRPPSGEQETRGLAEGRQVGEAGEGEGGDPGQLGPGST